MVEADHRQLGQVLRNLLLNAVEAMPQGGVARIAAKELTLEKNTVASLPAGAYVVISVADNGLGISPGNVQKIFEPYFSTKERFSDRGLGLGLAVCWSIVRKHGGAITVESTVGKGTVVQVYLRAARQAVTPLE
jgi:signal transduction histidine kinase